MSPEAVGVHSNWGFSSDALCNGEGSMEQDWVWLGPTGVGVIGGHYKVV